MKRNALLIGNTGGLEGVSLDIERTERFLKSALGGQWHTSEITKLLNPTRHDLGNVLNRMRADRADYTFVLFTGHGSHYGQTELWLNDRETFPESELIGIAERQLSIFDCCRVERTPLQKAFEARAQTIDLVNTTRERFDRRIMEASKQQARLYSCAVGEVSYDTPNGAAYLGNLLDSAKEIPVGSEWLSVADAHSAARTKTIENGNRSGNKQTPAAVLAKVPRDFQLILSIK